MYASNVPLPPYPVRVLQGGPGVGVPFHSPLLHPLSGGGGKVGTVRSFITITDYISLLVRFTTQRGFFAGD